MKLFFLVGCQIGLLDLLLDFCECSESFLEHLLVVVGTEEKALQILDGLRIIFGRVLHRVRENHLVEIDLVDNGVRLGAAARSICSLRLVAFAQLDGIFEIIGLLDEPVGVVLELLFEFDFGLVQVLFQSLVVNVVGRHPEVPCVTIDDGAKVGSVAMDLAVDAVTNTKLVRGYTQGNIFALLDGGHFAHSRDEDRAVDAGADQKSVDFGIYVDVAVFASYDAHLAAFSVLHHDLLAVFDSHALVQTDELERPLARLDG